MMTLTRFKALCAAHGGAFHRWPEGEREAGEAFAETSEAAREALAEARLLDAALSQARSPSASPDLARRIAAGAPSPEAAPVRPRGPAWAGMAAALALTIGLGVGWLAGGTGASVGAPSDADLYVDAFGALDDGAALGLLEDA